jgi:hypothetical protein
VATRPAPRRSHGHHGGVKLTRACPQCGRELAALAVQCSCGFALPEVRDRRSDPDDPRCAVCNKPMVLMAERCPSCNAEGFPALRARRGKKSLGSPGAS